ncbi:MAG: beta-lactamase family protein [Planctomycetes bacterium]|nr:beta-lactamase family protein [Planctomycetota bacterium]
MRPLAALLFCTALVAQTPAALSKRVDDYLQPLVAQGLFQGSVLLSRGDQILHEKSYGLANLPAKRPNTPATQFKLISISKTLITVAILRLVQDGKLALADPIAKHLPDWPAPWSTVTLHDLLDHTSGIPDLQVEWTELATRTRTRGLAAWPAFAPLAQAKPLLATPGKERRYCNFSVELAGIVAEAVAGKNLHDLVRTTVFEPAGITATAFDDGSRPDTLATGYTLGRDGEPTEFHMDLSALQASVGLQGSVGDLHRFARALAGNRLISADTYARMLEPRLGTYACGWLNMKVHDETCHRHGASNFGYAGDFLRFPAQDACVVVLGNLWYAPVVSIGEDLAGILLGKKIGKPQALAATALDRAAGAFAGPDGSHLVLHRLGTKLLLFELEARGERATGVVMLPTSATAFAGPGSDSRIELDGQKRLRRTVVGKTTLLERTNAAAPWRAHAGAWKTTPDFGKPMRITAAKDRMALAIEGWPEMPLVPIDEATALVLFDATHAIAMHRQDGRLRLRLNDVEFQLEPQK